MFDGHDVGLSFRHTHTLVVILLCREYISWLREDKLGEAFAFRSQKCSAILAQLNIPAARPS